MQNSIKDIKLNICNAILRRTTNYDLFPVNGREVDGNFIFDYYDRNNKPITQAEHNIYRLYVYKLLILYGKTYKMIF